MLVTEAQQLVQARLAAKYGSDYVVDSSHIEDHEFAWYIPFISKNQTQQNGWMGASGYIIDKNTGEMMQPGNTYPIETWVYGFKIGLRYDSYDLIILQVNDPEQALHLLDELRLQYYREEFENGVTWKIPHQFVPNQLENRLQNLPATFYNQRLNLHINTFKKIIESKAFTYELKPTSYTGHTIGENLG